MLNFALLRWIGVHLIDHLNYCLILHWYVFAECWKDLILPCHWCHLPKPPLNTYVTQLLVGMFFCSEWCWSWRGSSWSRVLGVVVGRNISLRIVLACALCLWASPALLLLAPQPLRLQIMKLLQWMQPTPETRPLWLIFQSWCKAFAFCAVVATLMRGTLQSLVCGER